MWMAGVGPQQTDQTTWGQICSDQTIFMWGDYVIVLAARHFPLIVFWPIRGSQLCIKIRGPASAIGLIQHTPE
jgi:hypothetical protein